MLTIFALSLLTGGVLANPLTGRDSTTATVDLNSNNGAPKHVASGFIYGIPDNYPNQIPTHWWTDIDVRYCRTGGAQLGSPSRGWIYGMAEYQGRLKSSKLNYQACRAVGADVVLLPHDIWGTDHTNSSTHWPGDNGDWSSYDAYIKQLMNDLVSNNMLDGLVWDIWNEPDISVFWPTNRGQQRWIDLYIRTHKMIRADSRFNSVKISGPTLAFRPSSSNTWWTNWLRQISGNNTIMDQIAYHLEGGQSETDNDPQYTNSSLAALLKQYNVPSRETNINEYAEFSEMLPSGYVWWISRLERYNFWGLLGNWQSGTVLHDLFANLLTKKSNPKTYSATDYAAAPGYWVYKYYAQNMTGVRLATTGSTDRALDVYATKDSKRVRLLVGTKVYTGTWNVQVNNLNAVGLATSGNLSISTWGFDGTSVWTPQAAPTFRNTVIHAYSGNSITFPIHQTDNHTAWAFEFDVA